ncbi:hypothetical protein D3C73_1564400 [compost metagenome]
MTEDLPESYLAGTDEAQPEGQGAALAEAERLVAINAARQALEGEEKSFDPSGDEYDHFSAGIHL